MPSLLLMQPRGGAGTPDLAPAPAPAPPPDPAGTPAAPPPPPAGGDTNVQTTVVTTVETSSDLSQTLCQTASRNMLVAAGGYDLGGVLLGLLLFFVMKKRLWATVAVRYVCSLGLSVLAAGLLVGLDPVRADDLKRCLASAEFSRYVLLGQSEIARALALGVGPTLLVTLLGCFAINRLL